MVTDLDCQPTVGNPRTSALVLARGALRLPAVGPQGEDEPVESPVEYRNPTPYRMVYQAESSTTTTFNNFSTHQLAVCDDRGVTKGALWHVRGWHKPISNRATASARSTRIQRANDLLIRTSQWALTCKENHSEASVSTARLQWSGGHPRAASGQGDNVVQRGFERNALPIKGMSPGRTADQHAHRHDVATIDGQGACMRRHPRDVEGPDRWCSIDHVRSESTSSHHGGSPFTALPPYRR